MTKPKIVGLTGNIGCGKSTVAKLLSKFPGVKVLDSDQIAKVIIRERATDLNHLLGTDIFSARGMNSAKIAELIFSDREKKKKLEAFVFPLVWQKISWEIEDSPETQLFVIESALIYESGSENLFESVIAVVCESGEQMRRLRENRGMTEDEIKARLTHQLPNEAKASRAQFVIDTNCALSKLEARAKELYNKIKGGKNT